MSETAAEMWVVEFKAFNSNDWTAVNNIKYTSKVNALTCLGREIAKDPDYTHRLVRLVKQVECVITGTGEYNE